MKRIFKTLLIYWLPIGIYLGLIVGLSSMSSLPFRLKPGLHLDKLLHFLEYFLLALLMARACASLPRPKRPWALWILSSLLVLVVGGLDECYQSLVPNRSSELLDLLADGLGGMSGSGLYLLARFSWFAPAKDSMTT